MKISAIMDVIVVAILEILQLLKSTVEDNINNNVIEVDDGFEEKFIAIFSMKLWSEKLFK